MDVVTLDYGSGGKKSAALIEELMVPAFENEALSALGDGAVLFSAEKIAFSTDSFVVTPYFFPGGDIGKLAVCGTINDLAACGAEAKYLSLAFIIEEGFSMDELKEIVTSIADTARNSGVSIVTGDTKVVERGKADGIYINTAGIGFLKHPSLSPDNIRAGDAVLVSGTVGEHGAAVMLARNNELLTADLRSDCAALGSLAAALWELGPGLRALRDPTRGGVATTLCEFAEGRDFSIILEDGAIPVTEEVAAVCDILGLDPLYSANEGKLIAVVSPDRADDALSVMRSRSEGRNAAIIGRVSGGTPGTRAA